MRLKQLCTSLPTDQKLIKKKFWFESTKFLFHLHCLSKILEHCFLTIESNASFVHWMAVDSMFDRLDCVPPTHLIDQSRGVSCVCAVGAILATEIRPSASGTELPLGVHTSLAFQANLRRHAFHTKFVNMLRGAERARDFFRRRRSARQSNAGCHEADQCRKHVCQSDWRRNCALD